ncbi:ShlB/FhaC/HecB family hemolysin secretion/activation protein [Herbaspirillum rubrisubalbicans]|uniref:ShlB/FhaC/HecB family hemolysin secretion/activation protein n=1 Tax=Herbaspirillum rubrisubalbicans TaxID=80842 RepID=UPI0015EC0363|nr:ShlB/FhaC/HecB family hemolysin secretion/activation protein [Herbaspirillum rubrisubalbicans]
MSVYAAPLTPDAGQSSRELEKQPLPPPPTTPAPIMIETDRHSVNGDDSLHIEVKGFHISGNTAFGSDALTALLQDLIGQRLNLADLNNGVARLTHWYHQHGYAIARAYLPPQDIKDGIIEIRILEGRLDQQRIDNRSGLSNQTAAAYLDNIQHGEILTTSGLERGLMLLNETPGVGSARATLQPGASVGTSDLLVELTHGAPVAGSIDLDNYGNRYTGQYRVGASLAINNPMGIGDQIGIRALTSQEHLDYVRLAYQIPVGSSGLRVGAAYSDMRYQLGKEFAVLQAGGDAASSSVFAVYPLVRSQTASLNSTLSWEHKHLLDTTAVPESTLAKQVNLVTVGMAGTIVDGLAGGGINSIDASLAFGHLSMDARSLTADQQSAQSDNAFTRFTYTASRTQRLGRDDHLLMLVSGQEASKNLNSSEKFSLGGATGVRAYPQGEAAGDRGWLTSLEWHHRTVYHTEILVFYDAGSVDINRNPFTNGSNRRTLSGAGIGLEAGWSTLQLKAYMAWSLSGGPPSSEPSDATHGPRLWAQASYAF